MEAAADAGSGRVVSFVVHSAFIRLLSPVMFPFPQAENEEEEEEEKEEKPKVKPKATPKAKAEPKAKPAKKAAKEV